MDKEDRDISRYLKSNVETPKIVDEKINFAFDKLKAEKGMKKMNKKITISKIVAIVTALFLSGNAVSFAFGGPNIYTMIYEYFTVPEEEKVTNIMVEGLEEETDYTGLKSSIGYTIQYDTESLNLTREGEKDYYRANIEGFEDKVYFIIEYSEKSYDEYKNENKQYDVEEFEINGQKAFFVEFIDDILLTENTDYSWDSDVKTLWYIDAGTGTYCIEEHYFQEATEGWGERFNQMIRTIKIVNETK